MRRDQFRGCDIDTLLQWILAEEIQQQILGIHEDLFFVPHKTDPFRMRRYGQLLETPLGVAAGPHTQLSQNIIAAWLTGARYMELKTVQVLDELEVTKPCIDMTDEGYNCEWSQELKLDQSFGEYLKAWIILHILKDRFGWGVPDEAGFIFNMSVGYNLNGILSPAVQRFLDSMADCSQAKSEKIERLARFYPRVKELEIPNCISDNITISTMHGCPPEEVEKIGHYFITERRLNTTIKLNPTLLGPERLRHILNDQLGFTTVVPDLAFEHDLKYVDGVALIQALQGAAQKSGVEFNVKLTNTLESINREQNLPPSEQMVYMSGRALHPLSINLAARLQSEFGGCLDISFSAGTDCFNFPDVLACNLKPVTVCSDVLKPGGYGRLSQYLEAAGQAMEEMEAKSLDEFIVGRGRKTGRLAKARSDKTGLDNLQTYAETVVNRAAYKKESFPYDNIKTPRKLSTFDCIQAPCMTACPVSQDIPSYMYHTARGEYDQALKVILADNPFPHILGMACDHLCQYKCTRLNYDKPLLIREIKRFTARQFDQPPGRKPARANGVTVAIIGAGPSGLACAHFLAMDGFEVHIYEKKAFAGGWAADAIPAFRLDEASIKQDIDAILSLGVKIYYNAEIDAEKFVSLRQAHDYIYIAVGAQEGIALGVPGEDAEGVMDQLDFLSAVHRGERPDLGQKVAVIGGGNAAMDAARTAKRLLGEDGEVSVVYRRTQQEMPAAPEEIGALLDEGVKLLELTAPECMLVEGGRVTSNLCFRMELGANDASGRPRPIRVEASEFELSVDSVIAAIGQRVNVDFFPEKKLEVDPISRETQLENVFAGGDAVRGASTLVKAIGDGKKVAETIRARALGDFQEPDQNGQKTIDLGRLQKSKSRRQTGLGIPETALNKRAGFDLVIRTLDNDAAQKEAARCLYCDELCNVCVTVCPNRANIAFQMAPTAYVVQEAKLTGTKVEITNLETVRITQRCQVLNIGDFCNECGNCTTFCPTSGSPYLDKARFHVTAQSFYSSQHGYYFSDSRRLECFLNGKQSSLELISGGFVYKNETVQATLDKDYTAQKVVFKRKDAVSVNLRHAAEMAVLCQAVRHLPPLSKNVTPETG